MAELIHEGITRVILKCCFEVSNELGHGFLESVYHNALAIALAEKGLKFDSEMKLTVTFRGKPVGYYCPDLLVEDKVIVELKAVAALLPEHSAQVINYLKATGMDVGLLVNFGQPQVDYRNLTRPGLGRKPKVKVELTTNNLTEQDGQDR